MTIAQGIVDALTSGNQDNPELPLGPSIDVPQSLVAQIAQKVVRDYMDTRQHGKPIYDHSIRQHGIMYSDYFQGVSTVHTQWESVYTGTGENAYEALDEALDDAAMDGWDVRSIENEFDPNDQDNVQNAVRENNPDMEDDDDIADGVYYYVSIFVRGVPKEGVDEAKKPNDMLSKLGQVAIQAGKKWLTVGESISRGTARMDDLLFAYLDTLDQLDRAKANAVREEYKSTIELAGRIANGHAQVGDDIELVDHLVIEVLDPIMWEYCPPYTYFGSNPGDGTDIGCWPDRDKMDEDSEGGELTKFVAGTVQAIQFSEGRLPVDTKYVWIHNPERGDDSIWDAPRKQPIWHY